MLFERLRYKSYENLYIKNIYINICNSISCVKFLGRYQGNCIPLIHQMDAKYVIRRNIAKSQLDIS